eukprot:365836-Chlamydomonas_euryale.AAC.6
MDAWGSRMDGRFLGDRKERSDCQRLRLATAQAGSQKRLTPRPDSGCEHRVPAGSRQLTQCSRTPFRGHAGTPPPCQRSATSRLAPPAIRWWRWVSDHLADHVSEAATRNNIPAQQKSSRCSTRPSCGPTLTCVPCSIHQCCKPAQAYRCAPLPCQIRDFVLCCGLHLTSFLQLGKTSCPWEAYLVALDTSGSPAAPVSCHQKALPRDWQACRPCAHSSAPAACPYMCA